MKEGMSVKFHRMMCAVTFALVPFFVQAQVALTLCKCVQDRIMSSACKCISCQCHSEGHHNHSGSVNPFLKMMDTMMVRMDAVPLTGSVERNFLIQMIPHHEGAVEMAKYEIAHGKNFEMIQLAKSILTEQQGEIMEMNAMLANYPAGGSVDSAYKAAMDKTMAVMMENTPSDAMLPKDVDCSFAMVMVPHHQAAVDMAVALLEFNPRKQIAIYARRIIGDQQAEIEQMKEYIKTDCKK